MQRPRAVGLAAPTTSELGHIERVVEVRMSNQNGIGLGDVAIEQLSLRSQSMVAQHRPQAVAGEMWIDDEVEVLVGEHEPCRTQPAQRQALGERLEHPAGVQFPGGALVILLTRSRPQ